MKTEIPTPTPVEAEIAGHAFHPDVEYLKATGLPIDSSILPLVPREALWLERLNPSRYKIHVCVSRYSGKSDGREFVGPNKYIFAFKMFLEVDLRFFLSDNTQPANQQSVDISVATMNFRSKVPFHAEEPRNGYYFPVLRSAWEGFQFWAGSARPLWGWSMAGSSRLILPRSKSQRSQVSPKSALERPAVA